MTIFGKAMAGMALAAMTIGTVPAQAEWHGPRHRGHDRVDAGDVLLGAVPAGGLIALLSGKKHDEAPPPREDTTAEVPPAATDVAGELDGSAPTIHAARSDQEAAVDACVASAESEGRRYARIAKIDTVSAIDPAGQGWTVRGTLMLRDDYSRPGGDRRGFSCRVGENGVEGVMVDGGRVAAR